MIELLEKGAIPFENVGTHRRVRFHDLMFFKRKTEQSRLEVARRVVCSRSAIRFRVLSVSPFIVVYDACVLYPAPLRSFLMYLAMTGLFRARWTDAIHEEWMRNVQKNYPDITRDKAERIRDLMNAHVSDCLVTGYEDLIPELTLPDPDDRHVLAAAVRAGAEVIITCNLVDFPTAILKQFGIEARHPDAFILHLLDFAPEAVCAAAKKQRESLKRPPKTVEEFLTSLQRQGLTQTVAVLRRFAHLI